MKSIKRLFNFILLLLLAASAVVIFMGHEKYKNALERLPLEDAAQKIRSAQNFTEFEDIPDTFVNAMVSVEDRRFFYHKGIDIIGTVRALVNDIKQRSLREGGSSITQQLAKNIYYMQDNTATRKVAEMFTAVKIEQTFTKQEILELYFNTIYYGSGYYNVGDAARGYFGKEPSEMTAYEATLLAGLPNAPSAYSLDKNPDLAKKRQKKVLSDMVRCGYLSNDDADKILSEAK